jgi:hypothetical protein
VQQRVRFTKNTPASELKALTEFDLPDIDLESSRGRLAVWLVSSFAISCVSGTVLSLGYAAAFPYPPGYPGSTVLSQTIMFLAALVIFLGSLHGFASSTRLTAPLGRMPTRISIWRPASWGVGAVIDAIVSATRDPECHT